MKQLIGILILFLLLLSPSCKKAQNKQAKIINSEVLLDTADIKNKEYRKFMGKLAKEELNGFIKNSTKNLLNGKVLINNEEELIQLIEPILFRIYGKEKVIHERPYDAYLFGDYWVLMGTLPKEMSGGTFSIAINRKTCEIVGIFHGK
jgi:hypothetical protein